MPFPARVPSLARFALLLVVIPALVGCSGYSLSVSNQSEQSVLVHVVLPDPGAGMVTGGAIAGKVVRPLATVTLDFSSSDAVPLAYVWLGESDDGRLLFKRPINPGKTRLEIRGNGPNSAPSVVPVR